MKKSKWISTALLWLCIPAVVLSLATGCSSDDDTTPPNGENPPPTQPVVELSDAKQITAFVFRAADNAVLEEDVIATIDQEAFTVTLAVPFGTSLRELTPTIELSEKAVLTPTVEGPQSYAIPVTYTITAEDESTQEYTIAVSLQDLELTDRQILEKFYNDNLGNNLGWDLSAPNMDNWSGVTHENGTVTRLTLDFRNITILPKEIGALNSLQILNLGNPVADPFAGNKIGNIPAEIGNLSNLESLNVRSNNLGGIPREIGNLKNLKILELGNNSIATIPVEIGNLDNLERLGMENNNNLNIVPAEIGDLGNLKVLSLSNNFIFNIPAELGDLSNLETLSLSNNKLTSLPVEIANLSNLKELFLGGNNLTSLPQEVCDLVTNNNVNFAPSSLCN
ncbi:leucine-rich repeat domain-containing protein [Aquimarina algicola]|uniref:Disease resistance R13L4/SHOC-2-like LRR domain-containing protein n=1 Tax=Aquimarina algicola TaxID=2589995 RepID=A0A504J1B0_9FLAO|nr:leucine-rich repeat domain-containing protein [Aquimarina algicola]TPN82395.1 hypothetical protein FHK87_23530 [Aquimarina algicola]